LILVKTHFRAGKITQSVEHAGLDTSGLVDSHHDRLVLVLNFSLLGFEFVSISLNSLHAERESILGSSGDDLLVASGQKFLELVFLEGVDHLDTVGLKAVLLLDTVLDLVVSGLVELGFGDHLLNVFSGKAALVVGDGNLLLLAGSFVTSVDVEDTIGIEIEGDFNLGSTGRCGGDTSEVEFTELVAILGQATLSLVNLNVDTGLVVSVGGEHLGLDGGDLSVSGDQFGHDTTGGLDTLGKGDNVEEEEILDGIGGVTVEDSSLDGGTVSDGLIGVDGLVEDLAVEEFGKGFLDLGNTGGATDENDLVDHVLGAFGVLEDLCKGGHALLEVGLAKFLELGTGEVAGVVLTFSEGLAEDFGLERSGKNSLGLLALGAETTEGTGVASDVNAGLLLEVLNAEVDDVVIEILATKMSVTVGSLDLEDTVLNGEEGDIESATTKIEDEDVFLTLTLFVETVSDSGSGGLVDDSLDVETGDLTSILGGLTLGVIEVSGYSDNSLGDGLAEVGLSDFLHLDEDHGGDLLSHESLLLSLELDNDQGLVLGSGLDLEGPELAVGLNSLVSELTADKTLGIEDGVGGVSGGLVLGSVTNKALLLSEGNVGGGSVDTLVVSDDFDFVVLEDTNAGVGGSEINTDGRS